MAAKYVQSINHQWLRYLLRKSLLMLISKLKPHGFVLAAGLLPLVSKTVSHVFECLLRRGGLAPIRRGEPLCKNCCQSANLTSTNFANDLPNPKS